jgi:cytochrome c
MHTRNILIAALLTTLAACQPESSAPQQPNEPVAMSPVTAPDQAAAPQGIVSGKINNVEKSVSPKAEQKAPATETPKVTSTDAVKPVPAESTPPPVAVTATKPEAKMTGVLTEAEALALAKKSNCLACHTIAKKIVGPAWRDVAAKYRNDAGAEDRLVDKVAKGGGGVWGANAMPANPQVNEADRRKLVRFILSLK